jgi:sulfite exporter TauE/SafE
MVDGGMGSIAQIGFLAAGLFGFLGSTHCAGMCGPLVGLYTKQLQDQPAWRIQRQHLLYNLGRLLMYTNLGILLGAAGFLIGLLPWAAGVLGVLSGLFIAAMGLRLIGAAGTASIITYLTQRLTIGWRWHGRLARSSHILVLGALHGFLPCPLLYVMFTSAVAMQDPLRGGVLLFGFGLGTIPMMWAMGMLSQRMKIPRRLRFQRWYGIGVTAWGGVLVFHGVQALAAL